ncbi:motility associated factor glycosyltransferase family protein [Aeromonas hydrophila]|uniref:motility associated factor glycosyltransferase family protein n=1 Tax=Aeromonas hydrophila TaxID=644 RepID=UPI002B49FD76|nr:6-hydroxymethylpterin diphosphokinase MptE-like protein [Aeromonas hydrophila]
MIDYFPQHAELIARRWPAVLACLQAQDVNRVPAELVEGLSSTLAINGIQLTSRHDRMLEAERIVAMSSAKAPELTLYGTGLGDVPRVLLRRKRLRRLNVKIMNASIFALVLHLTEQLDWLSDPRVNLLLAQENELVMSPFLFLTSELELADESAAKIRDRVLIQSRLEAINEQFGQDWVSERLAGNLDLLREDTDVAQLFGTAKGRDAYVVATGPTLAHHLSALKAVYERPERPLFICVDTALRPLMAQGIKPDIVVTIDRHIHLGILDPLHSSHIALVYIPMVDNKVLSQWQGPRYGAYEMLDTYAGLQKKLRRASLFTGGSVIHPATDLAVRMGAHNITLFGADFSFPEGRTHTGWQDGELGSDARYGRRTVPNGHGQPVKTLLSFCIYLNGLEVYIQRHPEVNFMNSSRDGARILGTSYHEEFAG